MTILGIESSCDETSAAIIEKTISGDLIIKSNCIASSLEFHAKTGGIIPEVAAREQLKCILPVIENALQEGVNWSFTDSTPPPIDAIAVTYGPGLIGSLLVGVETARTLSYVWNKPLIPTNHLLGHIYANWLRPQTEQPLFPLISLTVSGAHTDLLFMKNHNEYIHLGGTRDDAAGEAFDKIGRLLGLAYPAGAMIEIRAKLGNAKHIPLPRPLIGSKDFDFSFSGLKTAVLREVQKQGELTEEFINDICASTLEAITNVLIKKTIKAAKEYAPASILLGGGVAANKTLTENMIVEIEQARLDTKLFVPSLQLCTDNGAMIAAAAYFVGEKTSWQNLTVDPELYFD